LSLDEKIIELVKNGETEVVEFKETLSLDIKKQTKQKYIEHSSLKTIAGFLNSKGGVLLVGVSDNGFYPGIFEEVEKFHKDKLNKANFDKFLLHFKNLIKRSIGEEFYPYIEYQLVDVNESKVLYVNCGKSEKPCYLDGKDFYVRTNPATDKLEGPKLVDYIQNHFS
jgi:predicted HTH transcriptional regulator